MSRCRSFLFKSKYGACIAKSKIADGEKDCVGGSNETNEWLNFKCNNYKFTCNNGECIDITEACDGIKNCCDGSDETEISCNRTICPSLMCRCMYVHTIGKT
ncbi:Low-density lipoprotein receptor domain class A [Popillia japonica]|uniref:Low-density lipoprotein receptor domain class A n=1 Tax=Popillia japonica TaxID=7064 RepID=A0AAW1NJR0_POPJA